MSKLEFFTEEGKLCAKVGDMILRDVYPISACDPADEVKHFPISFEPAATSTAPQYKELEIPSGEQIGYAMAGAVHDEVRRHQGLPPINNLGYLILMDGDGNPIKRKETAILPKGI